MSDIHQEIFWFLMQEPREESDGYTRIGEEAANQKQSPIGSVGGPYGGSVRVYQLSASAPPPPRLATQRILSHLFGNATGYVLLKAPYSPTVWQEVLQLHRRGGRRGDGKFKTNSATNCPALKI